jgi:hypothetical protein
MKTRKRFLTFSGLFGILALFALTACDSQQPQEAGSTETDDDRYHEKSFSWENISANEVLSKTAARQTRFQTAEELGRAVVALEAELRRSKASDSLWKPVDYACDELVLAIWNRYGTVRLKDSVVLDEESLKAGCRYIGENTAMKDKAPAGKSAAIFPTAVVTDRQYPYKMIGESWDDFNAIVYKSTGAGTQFKKERKIWGVTGWYDLDANRIGVRIYLIDCPVMWPQRCTVGKSQSDWYKDDDYVSKRDFAAGINVDLHVSDAVIGMHSVDHGGLQFRAISSSGLSTASEILSPPPYAYVTW